MLTLVIVSPIALSSQDLVRWATSTDGLGLSHAWGLLVFIALDAAAATCVLMVVYSAWRGETGGSFAVLVWVFALGSAYANRRYGVRTPAHDDDWFFPAMSLTGPALLEVTVRRIRRWVQTSAGRYERPLPHFRLIRWLPGIALRETARAWKLAVTEGYSRPEEAVDAARRPVGTSTATSTSVVDEVDVAPDVGPAPIVVPVDTPIELLPATPPPRRGAANKLPQEKVDKILADIRNGAKKRTEIAATHGVSTKAVQRLAGNATQAMVNATVPDTTENGGAA